MTSNNLRILRTFIYLAIFAVLTTSARADQAPALKKIDNPAGGHILYGPIANASTTRDAMASTLRYVHHEFGDKPQIGKLFQTKGSDSVATFFTLKAANQGNKPIAGMVIVTHGAKNSTAAILYDDQARFGKTQPALMRKLNQQWGHEESSHTASTSTEPYTRGTQPGGVFGSNDQAPPSQPLHFAAVSDNSASIGLPEGWHIDSGGGGVLHATGPHGESIAMGILNQNIYDPQTQQGANMINYLRRGTTPFTACPYSSDLAADYQCISDQNRRRRNLPPITMRLLSQRNQPGNAYQAAMLTELDMHDGKGLMTSSIHATAQRMGAGNWIFIVNQVNIPKAIADQEWPTIAGMIMSYRQNAGVIEQQTQQVIAQINARAEANRKLADARSQANDAHNKQVNDTWDDQAKQNKAFENYTLDRSVVQDNDMKTHGAYDYPTADWLVKSDPTRFQYVPTQDLLKGVDY